ncbi:predicted protein [Chaetoceros tenuissimus]|uniref:Uncharacterized protein n=1 Tax=Chaetoceros tenuissimus TaxID=426638 RepID=A0AAD3CSK5_9STRA|nr:predicted protein [Chaetoceros tenuissimus]
MHSLFGTAQFPSWNDTPITSLQRFTAMQRIPLQNTGHCIIQHIFNRYASPLIFSSDSAYDHQTNTTVAESILMHLDTHIEQDMLNISPKPVLIRNYILTQSYGTSFTDNNMGESHALTLSLNSCPFGAPTMFLLDSRIVLLQVFLYFHPHSKTIRQQLRKHIHITSMHHFSELSHALKCHWPDPSRRASRISYPSSVPHHVRNQFLEIIEQVTTDIGASNFCNQNLPSPTGSLLDHDETITENTVGLQIRHHLFLHIKSHQLTNYGNIHKKDTEAGQVEILPQPNFVFAMANTWADQGASRMAHSLQGNLPENLCTDIPHPQINMLQYTFHHNARTVNSEITQYMYDQFVNQNYKLAIKDPAQWYLQFSCFFYDPLGTFHNSTTLRKIVQEKAHSQIKLVQIDKDYRQCMHATAMPSY